MKYLADTHIKFDIDLSLSNQLYQHLIDLEMTTFQNFPMFTKHTDFSIQSRYLTVIAAFMQYVSKSLHIH